VWSRHFTWSFLRTFVCNPLRPHPTPTPKIWGGNFIREVDIHRQGNTTSQATGTQPEHKPPSKPQILLRVVLWSSGLWYRTFYVQTTNVQEERGPTVCIFRVEPERRVRLCRTYALYSVSNVPPQSRYLVRIQLSSSAPPDEWQATTTSLPIYYTLLTYHWVIRSHRQRRQTKLGRNCKMDMWTTHRPAFHIVDPD
jgi:hypothetical protein